MPKRTGLEMRGEVRGATDEGGAWSQARARISADHMLQLEICMALESLADSLPRVVDLRPARALVGVLEPSWTEHVSFQEEALFPILARRHDATRGAAEALERFRREHAALRDRHGEVTEQICLLVVGDEPNPDMLGYLLRGVFEAHRGHIEAERAYLESLLPDALDEDDRASLEAWRASRPEPPFPIRLLLGLHG